MIHGRDVLVSLKNETKRMGFYKSVKVRASGSEELLAQSIEQMRRDSVFMSAIANPKELWTNCVIEEVSPWTFRIRTGFLKGATFYDEPA